MKTKEINTSATIQLKDAEIVLGDFFEQSKNIPDGSADLVIIDGPYFRIKGGFDFVFKSFQEWQDLYRRIAEEVKRIISTTGTIIVWGHALRIAYQQIIFDEHFNLLNNAVWEKIDCQTKRGSYKQDRRLKPITERFLVYSASTEQYERHPYHEAFDPLRLYIKKCFESVKKNTDYTTNDKVAALLDLSGRMVSHWTTTSQWEFISKDRYLKLQELFPEHFPKEYAPMRKRYLEILDGVNGDRKNAEKLGIVKRVRRFFDNTKHKLLDVVRHLQQSNITKKYKHPTQKPPALTKILVETMSREGDLVVVPFGGSGTEAEAALECGRRVWVCEKDPKHHKTIKNRLLDLLGR